MSYLSLSGVRRAFAALPVLLSVLAVAVSLSFPRVLDAQARPASGAVLEAESLRPLAGVLVRAGNRHTFTDEAGRFTVPAPEGVTSLSFERLGYAPLTVALEGWDGRALLTPRPIALTELTVRSESRSELARGTALMVETVDRHQLHGRGHTSVAQSLAEAEGVSVAWTGSWGARPLLRGLGGERLAVLVDGNRVSRACNFGMDQGLATVDPATVERVEILTGPGSTLYGSGSVGGVINVVTRRPAADAPLSGEVRVNAGSAAPGGSVGGSMAARSGAFDVTGSADVSRFGDYRTPEAVVDGSSYRQGTFDLKGGWEPDPTRRLSLQLQAYEGREIGWPMSGHAEIPEEARRSLSADYAWQRGGTFDALSVRGYVQRVQHHMVMRMPMGSGMPGSGGMSGGDGMPSAMMSTTDARSHATNSGARAQLRLLPSSRSHLDMGVDLMHVAAEGTRWIERPAMGGMGGMAGMPSAGGTPSMGGMDGTAPPTQEIFRTWPAVRIVDLGLFAQGELRLTDRLALTAGARGDHVGRRAEGWDSSRDRVLTGNGGLRVELSPDWSMRASAGRGFRIPDATEYFGLALRPDGYVYRGNPELGTETSLNLEATLAHRRGPFTGSVTLFRNAMDGLIAPVAVPGEMVSGRPVRSYRNVDDALLVGGTFSMDVELHRRAALSAVVNHVRGEDRETGDYLPQLPPTEGSMALELRPFAAEDRWVELQFRGAARQSRNAVQMDEPETPGYGVLGLRGGVTALGVEWVGGVDNLLDRAYRSHVDPSPTLLRPGRNLFLSAVRRF
jgi:hemoglobin/transferrin/lactoferrin receptor protein